MKTLTFILLLLCYSICFSQTIEYPKFETDSLGQKVVVLTVEQAQSLDNSTDLIPLFKQLNVQVGTVDSACLKVVNDKDRVIAKQQVQIDNQKELILSNDKAISNLQNQIRDYNNKEILYKREIENKNKEINLHLDKITDLQVKMWVGGTLGSLAIIGLVVSIIALH